MILESRHNQGYQKYFLLKTIKKSALIASNGFFLGKNKTDTLSFGPPFGP